MQEEGDKEASTPNLNARSDRILDLRKNLREEISKREKIEAEKSSMEKMYKEKAKKVKQLKTDKIALEEQLKEQIRNVERLEAEKKEFEQKIERKKLKYKNLLAENQGYSKQVVQMKKTLQQLETDRGLLEKQVRRSSYKLNEELQKALEDQKNELSKEHNKKLEELQSESKQFQSMSTRIQRRSLQFDAKQVEETMRLEILEVEKKELEKKIKEQQKRIEELEQENTSNKNQIKQLTEKSNQKTQKLEAKVESLNEKVKTHQSQITILQKEKENLQNSAQQLQQIVASKANSSSIAPIAVNLDAIKNREQFVIDLYENEPPPSVERKTSTTSSNASKDQRFDDNLLKQPGAERAKMWTYSPNGNIDSNSYKWDDGNWSSQCIVIKMEKRPFAEGSLRTAYYTRNLVSPDVVYVAKFSKNRSHGREIYENDVEMQIFCQKWAEKFNLENPPKRVSFCDIWLLELIDRPHQPVATLEVYLEGEYRKYSNNDGQVSGTRNTPQAFSHWTYERSQHDFVIIDIQGVNDFYTDPQVHTKDHKGFGIGNLGQKGIVKFLITHQCNAVCKYLKLPNTQERYLQDKSSSNLVSKSVVATDKGTMAFPKNLVDLLEFDKEIGLVEILDQYVASSNSTKMDITTIRSVDTLKGDKFSVLAIFNKFLFAGSGNNINVYDLSSYYSSEPLSSISSSSSGNQISTITKSSSSGSLNKDASPLITNLRGHLDIIEALCYNSEYLFSGSADKDIRVWSMDTWKCASILTDHTSNVKALVVDKEYLYSGGNDKTVRVWSLKDFSCVHVLIGHEKFVKALAISQDSRMLFSGGNDNLIKVWNLMPLHDVSHKKPECAFNLDSHTKWLKSLSVWDLKTLELIKTMKPHQDKINVVLATNQYLFSASDDSTIKIYDYKTLECVQTLSEHKGMVISICMNDKFICSVAFDGIKIWTWNRAN